MLRLRGPDEKKNAPNSKRRSPEETGTETTGFEEHATEENRRHVGTARGDKIGNDGSRLE